MARARTSEPLRGAFIAIIAAAIGALGTLGGNALSNANAQNLLKHDDQVRQDDLRLNAYSEFTSVATGYVIRLKTGKTGRSDIREIVAASGNVQLVGSRGAANQAYKIQQALTEITAGALSRDLDLEEAKKRARETGLEITTFVDLARAELN